MTLSRLICDDTFRKGRRSGFLRATGTPKAAALNPWPVRAAMADVSALPGHACPPPVRHFCFAQPRTFQLGCNRGLPAGHDPRLPARPAQLDGQPDRSERAQAAGSCAVIDWLALGRTAAGLGPVFECRHGAGAALHAARGGGLPEICRSGRGRLQALLLGAVSRHFPCLETAWEDGIARGRAVGKTREAFAPRAKELGLGDKPGVEPLPQPEQLE
jgi:hypothetical protein